jgi:selenide,water dikinase
MTDVTGFGLAGHLLEICRGAKLRARVQLDALPTIDVAVTFAKDGIVTGASARNWNGYGAQVAWPSHAEPWQRALVADPQTSGGLLVSCRAEAVDAVLAAFVADGFEQASRIGTLHALDTGASSGIEFDT